MNKCEDARCTRQNKEDHWHIELNKYQRDNLMVLLLDYMDIPPCTVLDTGDWRKEIVWLLDVGTPYKPNAKKEDMQLRISAWLERQNQ